MEQSDGLSSTDHGDRDGIEIIGFSLLGPPPLGEIHLQWNEALHVAYGINGAGKSVLLSTIAKLLRFEPTGGHAFVHMRLSKPFVSSDGWFVDELLHDIDLRGGASLLAPTVPKVDWAEVNATSRDFSDLVRLALRIEMSPIPGTTELAFDRISPSDHAHLQELSATLAEEIGEIEERDASDVVSAIERYTSALESMGIDLRPDQVHSDFEAAESVWREISGERTISLSPTGNAARHLDGQELPVMSVYLSSGLGPEASYTAARVEQLRIAGVKLPGESNVPHDQRADAASLIFGDRPSWVPSPICLLGEVGFPAFGVVGAHEIIELDEFSSQQVRSFAFDSEERDSLKVSSDLEITALGMNESIDALYSSLLLRAPSLRVGIEETERWLDGRLLSWQAFDVGANEWIPVSTLSRAQQRWAGIAIETLHANREHSNAVLDVPRIVLIDEPENALHPQAISHMFDGLGALVNEMDAMAIVATHSPQILGSSGVTPLHVRRNPLGKTEVVPFTETLRNDLDEMAETLELRPADLMQIFQVVLIVEGVHDSTVLQAVYGDEWARARTRILHLSGTRNLVSVAGADVLFGFSDAEVVVLLDNATEHRIPDVWRRAQALASDGKKKEALRLLGHVEAGARSPTDEELKALEFCGKAIHLGAPHRIHLYGLSRRDIINYLDPKAFVSSDLTWEQLGDEYRHRSSEDRRQDFKTWLRRRPDCHTSPSVKSIKRAASDLADNPPVEIADLLALCRDLGLPETEATG